jgi:hypothetical protein
MGDLDLEKTVNTVAKLFNTTDHSKTFAKISQVGDVRFTRYFNVVNKHTSTLDEYHKSASGVNNRAGREIDAGREPYLFNLEADDLDMHPFVTVYDCLRCAKNDLIGVDLRGFREPVYLSPDTLVVWR